MSTRIEISLKLPVKIKKKKNNLYVASCPALDVFSQGETSEEARTNIAQALYLFLRSCVERGTLDAVLRECGFTAVMEQGESPRIEGAVSEKDYVDVPLELLSRNKDQQRCHPA
ncbi:MAG: type II toxin-antitoxin system HicB family antitoxin [Syntrophobacteraceae bacterium]